MKPQKNQKSPENRGTDQPVTRTIIGGENREIASPETIPTKGEMTTPRGNKRVDL